nr:ribonuclease H-like domain-containing protein [Tanacetum cinerariifolium]
LNKSEGDNNQANDRYEAGEGYHAVPSPYTGNFMPLRPDLSFAGLDDSIFKSAISETVTSVHETKISASETSKERKSVLNNEGKATSQREVKPVWNNAHRVNHQNFSNNLTHPHPRRNFVPTAVITNSGKVPVNTAKQSSLRAAASTSTARYVNTASTRPTVNEIDGGFVAFGGSPKGAKISRKCKIRFGKLDFEDVYFVKELKFNLFFVSQMCDKKNSVLFTETECLFLSPDFKLLDENQVLLKVPRNNNMYSFDLKNVVPSGGLTCLFAKAIIDESNLWYRRLGHINFKTVNKLVRGNLVRGLPLKIFENDHSCVACQKGKQHKASCKFDGKADKGFLVGYSVNIVTGNQTNDDAGIEINVNAGQAGQEKASDHEYILLSFMPSHSPLFLSIQSSNDKDADEAPTKEMKVLVKEVKLIIKKGLMAVLKIMPSLKENGIFNDVYDDRDMGAEADTNNLELLTIVSHIPKTRLHKDHPKEQIIRDLNLSTQTRRMINFSKENAMVFRNKKDERGIIVRNKTRLVVQGYTQEEGIDYDEVFAPIARIEAIGLFFAYASFMRFIVYQMDVKSVFLYGTIEEEVYVCQPFGFQDPYFPNKVYKTSNTPMEPSKALIKDAEAEDVDVHLYRSMIGSLMYLIASRPNIMFAVYVCACARFQVTPKTSHLYAQTVVANSTTKAKYVTAVSSCGKVLWSQNQMLDYGFNLMNTKIYIDNESTICLVKNPVFHSKTKHIEIRHHFIRDSYEKKLIQIRALVDGKKIIITEASIRRDLQLQNAKGTACLPNAAIFEELARMGTMASAIISLANNQKFNFSKYILDNMVKNLEARVKFYMFPRFVQVFVNHQLGNISHHKGIFVNPSLTKKRKHKSRRKQRKETEVPHTEPQTKDHIPKPSHDPLPSGEDRMQLFELMEICIKLSGMVLSLEQIKTNQATKIEKLKKRVKNLKGKKKKKTYRLKRLYKVRLTARVESSKEEESLGDQEDASKQERIAEIDNDKYLSLINETA